MFTTQAETLEGLIEDPELCNVYEEFLVRHYAWENFGFWFEVQNYKKEEDPEKRKVLAQLIFAKFLQEDSIFELGDMDVETRDAIKDCLENPPLNLFDLLQRRAFDTLAQSTLRNFLNDKLFLYQQERRNHNPNINNARAQRRGTLPAFIDCFGSPSD